MPQVKKHASAADKQRAYNQRKRNKKYRSALETVTIHVPTRPMRQKQPKDGRAGDERYTPRVWVDRARAVMGGIDLDVASCDYAQQAVQAARYYTQDEDALTLPWAGRVWMNPPYSDPFPWVDRLIAFYQEGTITAAITLLNMAGTPAWARMLWHGGYTCCVLGERIQFELGPWATAEDRKRNSNDRDQFVWYLGRDQRRFADVFSPYGTIR
jgi:hypothetical protein